MTEMTSPIARFLVVFAAFVIVVSGLKMAGPLLVPFLLAVFIAMIVSPLLDWLKSFRIPSGLAIFLVVLLLLGAGLILGAVIGSSLTDFRQEVPAYSEKLSAMREYAGILWQCDDQCGDDSTDSDFYSYREYGLR